MIQFGIFAHVTSVLLYKILQDQALQILATEKKEKKTREEIS